MGVTRMFCACCGTDVPPCGDDVPDTSLEHFCVPCRSHVLKHPEGVVYWRATWAAQREFRQGEHCPFDVGVSH